MERSLDGLAVDVKLLSELAFRDVHAVVHAFDLADFLFRQATKLGSFGRWLRNAKLV